MGDAAHDACRAVEPSEFPDVSSEVVRELEQLVADWTRRHVKLDAWVAEDTEPVLREDHEPG